MKNKDVNFYSLGHSEAQPFRHKYNYTWKHVVDREVRCCYHFTQIPDGFERTGGYYGDVEAIAPIITPYKNECECQS